MTLLSALRPELLLQPRHVAHRLLHRLPVRGAAEYELPLPWGLSIRSRVFDHISKSIACDRVYDLALTEALWRLLSPGDTVVDVGANIGYMTLVAAARLRSAGRIFAFEPHPGLFAELSANVERAARHFGGVEIIPAACAISDRAGSAWLSMPAGFEINRGLGQIADKGKEGAGVSVPVVRLEDSLTDVQQVALLKIDVEGHELRVLRGAERLIAERRLKHVLFEEHGGYPTPVSAFLESSGYTLFAFARTLVRPHLLAPEQRSKKWAAQSNPGGPPAVPSFLATLDPVGAVEAFRTPGWRALGT